jgi:hypothetical protein
VEEAKPPEEEMLVAGSLGGEEGARISRRKAHGSCPMLIPDERKPLEEQSSEMKPRKRWHGAVVASLYGSVDTEIWFEMENPRGQEIIKEVQNIQTSQLTELLARSR